MSVGGIEESKGSSAIVGSAHVRKNKNGQSSHEPVGALSKGTEYRISSLLSRGFLSLPGVFLLQFGLITHGMIFHSLMS